MNMATAVKMPQAERSGSPPNLLLVVLCLLLTIGLLMMTSASLEIAGSQYGDSFYYFKRQLLFVGIGLGVLVITLHIPMRFWYRMGYPLLLVSVCLLWLVLYVGKNVGGSVRWLDLGVFNLQPSEMAKVFVVLFTAAYLERHIEKVRERWLALFILLGLVSVAVGLILLEPDHGISGIMVVTVFCMIFLAGIKIGRLMMMLTLGIVALVSYAQMKSYEYLIARFQSFLEPCAPEYVYSSGYQLCQALIGFGRGEWYGVGLGSSIQKLYFLPEAHNDFLLAIIGEELGLLGVAAVILLFCLLVGKGFSIAGKAQQSGNLFNGFVAYGISLLFAGYSLYHIGMNIGLLPTKGLTLPFLSYGGSNLIMACFQLALLLRIQFETTAATRLSQRLPA